MEAGAEAQAACTGMPLTAARARRNEVSQTTRSQGRRGRRSRHVSRSCASAFSVQRVALADSRGADIAPPEGVRLLDAVVLDDDVDRLTAVARAIHRRDSEGEAEGVLVVAVAVDPV